MTPSTTSPSSSRTSRTRTSSTRWRFPDGDTLYGLYQGTPLPERPWSQGPAQPDRVTIYQRPIEEDAESEDDIVWMVGETVIHEFGHYFGLSEDEIEAIEERYWRGEGDEDDDERVARDADDEPKGRG